MLRLAIVASVLVVAASFTLPADECPSSESPASERLHPPCGSNELLSRDQLESRFKEFLVRHDAAATDTLATGAASNECLAVTTTFPLANGPIETAPPRSLSIDVRAQQLFDEIASFRKSVEQNSGSRHEQREPILIYVPIQR